MMINVFLLSAVVLSAMVPDQVKAPAAPATQAKPPASPPAQAKPLATPRDPAKPPAAATLPPAQGTDYIVGPQDVLTITVYEEPQLSGRFIVNSDGTFAYPMVGRVQAGGLSPRAIEESLTRLLSSGYLKKPELTVDIEQYRSQSITVSGEVRTPGKVSLTGRMTVLEALLEAGSVTPNASNEVQVLRPKVGPTGTSGPMVTNADIIKVNVADLQSGKLSNNVVLRDGDTVFVPKAEPFFVSGQVRNPGAYPLQRGMTVLQALSVAGGVTDRGTTRRIKVVRIVDGKKKEVSLKLTDLVQPGDTLIVPQRFF